MRVVSNSNNGPNPKPNLDPNHKSDHHPHSNENSNTLTPTATLTPTVPPTPTVTRTLTFTAHVNITVIVVTIKPSRSLLSPPRYIPLHWRYFCTDAFPTPVFQLVPTPTSPLLLPHSCILARSNSYRYRGQEVCCEKVLQYRARDRKRRIWSDHLLITYISLVGGVHLLQSRSKIGGQIITYISLVTIKEGFAYCHLHIT